jgi:hypothetical protein
MDAKIGFIACGAEIIILIIHLFIYKLKRRV